NKTGAARVAVGVGVGAGPGTASGARPAVAKLEKQGSTSSNVVSPANEKSVYPELEQLTPVFADLGSNDWAVRMTGLTKLSEWIESYPAAANVRCVKIFEQLIARLTDSNKK